MYIETFWQRGNRCQSVFALLLPTLLSLSLTHSPLLALTLSLFAISSSVRTFVFGFIFKTFLFILSSGICL